MLLAFSASLRKSVPNFLRSQIGTNFLMNLSHLSVISKCSRTLSKRANLFFQTAAIITTITSSSVCAAEITGSASSTSLQSNPQIEARVNNLVGQMTLDEKIKMLSGTPDEFHVPGTARLKIPQLKFSDAQVGVRCFGRSTAYPAAPMLAAGWNIETASAIGRSLGRDCRARGVHVLLAPGGNLYRMAQYGRNFEYFGEDPYLASRITVPWIQAVQNEKVATCIKPYVANDQETQRMTANSIVDERRLHEICFPTFKAAIVEANSWTLMVAYNKLNGVYCTASKYLLNDLLNKEWGFRGIVMSDWGAVHDCLGPLLAGTDLEMGHGVYYVPKNIKALLKSGKLNMSVIDDHVKRVVRTSAVMGFLDRDQKDSSIPLDDPESAATALRIAREGLVLLKNEGQILPLERSKTKSIVVIGPNACPAVTGGGGSSFTDPIKSVSLLDAVKKAAGKDIVVNYIPTWMGANPTLWSSFKNQGFFETPPDGELRGARGEYFSNPDLNGAPVMTRLDETIDFDWSAWSPSEKMKSEPFSVRWHGTIKAQQTDNYVFACSSNGAKVTMDGRAIFDSAPGGTTQNATATIALKAGEEHEITIEYRHRSGVPTMRFNWGKANEEFTDEEAKQLAQADLVIAALGYNPNLEGEGFDRTYDLPSEQVRLLKKVSKLNPHTAVVLNAGGNVGMEEWIDLVPSLIHAWYPGQNGNTAVAESIFGDLCPSGRLPITFERKWEDAPAFGTYPGDPKNGGAVKYTEGIYVGYRWFDKKNIEPRFPFGYGLSYTTFSMQNLKVERDGDHYNVSVDVKNTGKRAGAAVAQLYVKPLDTSTIDRPIQELKGFRRVLLEPGETKSCQLTLDASSFALYDPTKHKWISPEGSYEIAIGSSSRDIHCSKSISWKPINKK